MRLSDLIRERRRIDARKGFVRRRGDRRHMRLEWIRSHPGVVYYGGDSVTIAKSKVKYVMGWTPYFPFTPGELARIYLDDLMARQLHDKHIADHWTLTSDDKAKLAVPAPLAFAPDLGRDGHFVYIDIAACYFELMIRQPLTVRFLLASRETRRQYPKLVIPDADHAWLRKEKPLRHAIFGMLSAAGMSYYKDGKPVRQQQRMERYTAPDLVALVKLNLHKIARKAMEDFDCRMWLTDAGIFGDERQGLLFQLWLAREWGLSSTVKHNGRGHLFAQGSYHIGRYSTLGDQVDLRGWGNLAQ